MINSETHRKSIEQFKEEIFNCPTSIKESTLKSFINEKNKLEQEHATRTYSKIFTLKATKIKLMPPEEYAVWYLDYLDKCVSHLISEGISCPD